ncbi:MAG: hypothetical protein QOG96_5973, partial [Pseudonocardiales bacterium]|nr:hypothetical protein [Pseudonocardiales bacterium]
MLCQLSYGGKRAALRCGRTLPYNMPRTR